MLRNIFNLNKYKNILVAKDGPTEISGNIHIPFNIRVEFNENKDNKILTIKHYLFC